MFKIGLNSSNGLETYSKAQCRMRCDFRLYGRLDGYQHTNLSKLNGFDDLYVGAGDGDGAAVFELGFEDADHGFGFDFLELFRETGDGAEDAE